MSFCGNQQMALTDADMNAIYGTLENPGIIPPDGFPSSSLTDSGLLTSESLKSTVNSLMATGRIPRPAEQVEGTANGQGTKVDDFLKKDKEFTSALKAEYCFYDSRYKYALRLLIEKLQEGYTASNQQNAQLIQTYLQTTNGLNRRLNHITQLCNAIAQNRTQYSQAKNSSISDLNGELSSRSKKLAEQNKILSSQQASTLLLKDMAKYSKEHVDSTNNILSLYTFMNIIVLGLLFYLYRSVGE